jgi:tetratricopeptide (TPR) repeat protein
MVVTVAGTYDKAAQLWDAATGEPIGPPLPLASPEYGALVGVAFTADGRFVVAFDRRRTQQWDAPAALVEDPDRLKTSIEAATGLALDDRGSVRLLEATDVMERRRRLDELGGPTPFARTTRLDPIHFGANPAARADVWKERGMRDHAESAYADAIRDRPLDRSLRSGLARLRVERGHLDQAAEALVEGMELMPDEPELARPLALVLLRAGNRAGWRRTTVALSKRLGGGKSARLATSVAWVCSLGADGVCDPDDAVRLAERGIKGAEPTFKADALRTLAAALYRAGRSEEALRRLDETIHDPWGAAVPQHWALAAMAYHRLRQHAEARRWLERLRYREPSPDPARFWDEMEIDLLRAEAEGMIVYDPAFPADPFAHYSAK